MSVGQLERGFRELAEKLYSEEATQERRRRFRGKRLALRRQQRSGSASATTDRIGPEHS